MKQLFFSIILSYIIGNFCVLSYAEMIDFYTWTPAGSRTAVWSVSQGGREVVQSKRIDSIAYFLSPQDYINVSFHGSFGVNTTYDDDFIGFVFGYRDSNDYLLFDWKQADNFLKRGKAYEGFTLSHVHGTDINLWDHSGGDITVLAYDYGSGKGWDDNVLYSFDLNYTPSYIKIMINNNTIFDVYGNFDSGKLGLYVYSQQAVMYKDFELKYNNVNALPEPPTIIILFVGFILGVYIRVDKLDSNRVLVV